MRMKIERAVFAAGCFWGVQAAFDRLPGVPDPQAIIEEISQGFIKENYEIIADRQEAITKAGGTFTKTPTPLKKSEKEAEATDK